MVRNSDDDDEDDDDDDEVHMLGQSMSMIHSSRTNLCPRSPKRLSRRSDGASLRKMAKQSEALASPRMSALASKISDVVHENSADASPPSLAPITA
jgi:hypothetical protein